MTNQTELIAEVVAALATLTPAEQKLIRVVKAVEVVDTAYKIIARDTRRFGKADRKEALRHSINENHAANSSQELKRQRFFTAYWHLGRRVDESRRRRSLVVRPNPTEKGRA